MVKFQFPPLNGIRCKLLTKFRHVCTYVRVGLLNPTFCFMHTWANKVGWCSLALFMVGHVTQDNGCHMMLHRHDHSPRELVKSPCTQSWLQSSGSAHQCCLRSCRTSSQSFQQLECYSHTTCPRLKIKTSIH